MKAGIRLERVFKLDGSDPRGYKSQAINAAVSEGKKQFLRHGKTRSGIFQKSLRKRLFTDKARARKLNGRVWVGGLGFSSASWPRSAMQKVKNGGVKVKMGVFGVKTFSKAFIIQKNGRSIVLRRENGKLREVLFHHGPGFADFVAPVRNAVYQMMRLKMASKLRGLRIRAIKQ